MQGKVKCLIVVMVVSEFFNVYLFEITCYHLKTNQIQIKEDKREKRSIFSSISRQII